MSVMGSIGRKWRLTTFLAVVMGGGGCGGADDSSFSPTRGSASPDAPRTPEEVDANIEKTKSQPKPKANPRQRQKSNPDI